LSEVVTGTIIPWLLGTLLITLIFTFGVSVKSWRDMKRSPYFFMRRQAEKRLHTYLSTSFVLLLLTAGISAYSWRAPTDNINRVAVLANTKPPQEEIVLLVQAAPEVTGSADLVQALISNTGQLPFSASPARPTLPPEFNELQPTVDLKPTTELSPLAFSVEINERYEPLSPARIFPEGFYTLYAIFEYSEMADGMVWSWVWRRNGEVIDGGNQEWQYGDSGPGYVYLAPEEGFLPGDYTLDVWVNGELLTRSSLVVNNAAISAGN
jgi:hypothetical protein